MTALHHGNLFEFVTSAGGGQHVINNFVAGDQLYVEGLTFSQLTTGGNSIAITGGNTVITLADHTTITLHNFTGLNSSDIKH
jgi:hypothetical protein